MKTALAEIEEPLTKFLKPRVTFALLFGSVLTDYFRLDSDVDVAVFLDRVLNPRQAIDLQDQINVLFQYKYQFDLVLLDSADPIITMQVLANGRLIINNDPGMFVRYKAQKISQYLDFKMNRKIIEDRIVHGSIYA